MSTDSAAKLKGKDLLNKYREQKSHQKNLDLNSSRGSVANLSMEDEPSTAVADGSTLAFAFSEKKKAARKLFGGSDAGTDNFDSTPLEIVRQALAELQNTRDNVGSSKASSITVLLQGLEEQLENRSNSRIRRKANQSGFLDDSNLDSVEPYSTLGEEDPKAKQKEVLKVYMENQLDLNESEMEYYEGVIEDLAAQLEKMREEKDDLQSTTGSLEEKFQMLESRNMDLLEEQRQEFEDKKLFYVTKINELQKQVKVADELKAVEEFKFSEEIQKVRDELSIKYRENEDLKQRLHLIEQEKLADKLFLQNQIDIQNEQITEMANRFEPVGVEQSIRNNNLTDDEVETILEENLQLKMRLQDAEAQLMDSQSEVDSLNQLVEDLKGRTELLPLESSNVDELKTLQQALALKDKDISSLEIKVQQLEDEITKGRAISKIDELQNVRTPSSVKHSVSHRSTPSHDVSDFDFVAAFIKNNDGDETVAKSASSDNEASYASQNLDELRSTLQLKDQQLKVQIHQLQSLQDSLSEQKSATATLKDQRNQLKELLDQCKAELKIAHGKEDLYSGQVEEMHAKLADLTSIANTLNTSIEENQLTIATQEATIKDLMNEVDFYKQQKNMAMESQTSNRKYQQEKETLHHQLRQLQVEKNSKDLEIEKLNIRLESKSQQLEHLNKEHSLLREELDARLEEIDSFKLYELKHDASMQLQQIDDGSIINSLKDQIEQLNNVIGELQMVLQSREADLVTEKQANSALREFLEKIGDKDETTEQLLDELKDQRDNLVQQLNKANQEINAKDQEISGFLANANTLRQQLNQSLESVDLQRIAFQRKLNELEQMLSLEREKGQIHDSDTFNHVQALESRMSSLVSEKAQLEELTRKQKLELLNLENEISAKGSLLQKQKRSVAGVRELLTYFDSKFQKFEVNFAKAVDSKLDRYDKKLRATQTTIHKLNVSNIAGKVNQGMSKEELVSSLKETQAALERAIHRHEEDSSEKSVLREKLSEAKKEMERLAAELLNQQNSFKRLTEAKANEDNNGNITSTDYARIVERLDEAEQRAIAMSTDGAKSFARSARTIAFLEGECGRLKTLVDHLRLVNVKLTGDLKLAHQEGMQCRSLEHRLKLNSQEEEALQAKVRSLENSLAKKEKDLLSAMKSLREQEDKHNIMYENDVRSLNEKLRITQESSSLFKKERDKLNEKIEYDQRTSNYEKTVLEEKNSNLLNECSLLKEKLHDQEKTSFSLKSSLSEKNEMVEELAHQVSELEKEILKVKEINLKKLQEVQADNLEKQNRIKLLEHHLGVLKGKLVELENSYLEKDEELANKLSSRAAADEELRSLRKVLETLSEEKTQLLDQVESLSYQLQTSSSALIESKKSIAELQDITLPEKVRRLNELESLYRRTSEDLEAVRGELCDCHEFMKSTKDALIKTETALLDLQAEYSTVHSNEQLLRSSNESLAGENEYLREQVDEFLAKLSKVSDENVALRDDLVQAIEQSTEYEIQLRESTAQLNAAHSKIQLFQKTEHELLPLIDDSISLLTIIGTEEGGLMSGNFNGSDLFSSPTLTVVRTPIEKYQLGVETCDGESSSQGALQSLRQRMDVLKFKSEGFKESYLKLVDNLKEIITEKKLSVSIIDNLNNNVQAITFERDQALEKVDKMHLEIETLASRITILQNEGDLLKNASDSTSSRVSSILSYLDNSLVEILGKANDSVAGIIPIEIDALPNFSITQSLINLGDRSHLTDDTVVVNSLNVAVSEVERVSLFLHEIIIKLVGKCREGSATFEQFERNADKKAGQWKNDRLMLLEKINKSEDVAAQLSSRLAEIEGDLISSRHQCERYEKQLNDALLVNSDLEVEFRGTASLATDLRTALNDAESLCIELRGKVRALESDLDRKSDEYLSLNEQLEISRGKAMDAEMQVERTLAQSSRLRAEKEALDNVRRSLEMELDRCRAELNMFSDRSRIVNDETSALFEIEKLLAALGTTLDQISSTKFGTGQREVSTALVEVSASPNSSFVVGNDKPIAERVEEATSRLSALRSWFREDARSRRLLESQLESVSEDLKAYQLNLEDGDSQLSKSLQANEELRMQLQERNSNLDDFKRLSDRLSSDLMNAKTEISACLAEIEEEKKQKQIFAVNLQSRESELRSLATEIETLKRDNVKVKEEVYYLKEQLSDVQGELEQRTEQLRQVKINREKVIATLEELERGANHTKFEREALEQKLLEESAKTTSTSVLKARLAELEQSLQKSNESLKMEAKARVVAEEKYDTVLKDLESCKRKNQSLENRITAILREKSSFVDEISSTRQKIAEAKELAELERLERMKTEAISLENHRRDGIERKFLIDDQSNRVEVMAKQHQADEEKRILKLKISELRMSCEEKEAQRLVEQNDRRKLENDIRLLKDALTRRNAELTATSNYSSMLRAEGRGARDQILLASAQMKEITNIVRIDAKSVGIDIPTPIDKSSATKRDAKEDIGLSEALGISELSDALSAFKEVIHWIRSIPQKRVEMESEIRRLEAENANYQRELRLVESKKSDLMTQYKEEISIMQTHINELRKTDNKNPHLIHQISVLESALQQEKQRREKCSQEVESLKEQLSKLSEQLASHSNTYIGLNSHELENLRSEVEKYKQDAFALSEELKAVNHHRNVLRDTVEEVEKRLRETTDDKSERLFDQSRRADRVRSSIDAISDGDIESLKRQIARYKARASAMDELAGIYRTSVLALYADGASYGAAQFGWQPHGRPQEFPTKGIHLIGVGWIEREMATVKHSFEDEIRSLDSEVNDLKSKLKQANSFNAELRRRFEENMKSNYRNSRNNNSDQHVLQQYEQVREALEKSQDEVNILQQDLTHERMQGRRKHLRLIDDLTKALQTRDAALAALKRLEKYCIDHGLDVKGMTIYETFKSEMSIPMVSGQGSDKDKAIHALMKGLVETDHELAEAERRASRKPTEGLLNKGSLNTSREVLAYDKKSANDSDHWREYSDSLKAKAETVAKNSSKASAAESHIDTYNLSTAQSDLRSSTKGSSSLRVSKGSQAKYGFR